MNSLSERREAIVLLVITALLWSTSGVLAKVLDWQLVYYDALICGLALSLVLTILTAISGSIALDMFVDKYPLAIKEKYGAMSQRAARLRPFIAAL